jgi:hypothetical protein
VEAELSTARKSLDREKNGQSVLVHSNSRLEGIYMCSVLVA